MRLQLWDIAGQERFGNMTRVYYKDAVGAFLLFDVTRIDSFNAVERWKDDLDSKVLLSDGRSIPCVLVGNKCDQPASGTVVGDQEKMAAFAKDKGFAGYFAASARENTNVEEAAAFLIERILENERANIHQERGLMPSVDVEKRRWSDRNANGPHIFMLEDEEEGGRKRGECACKF